MYPNIGFFVEQTTGINIPVLHLFQMFGFFLALAFLVAGFIVGYDLIRREKLGLLQGIPQTIVTGEPPTPIFTISNGLVAFFIAFKVVYIARHIDTFKTDPFGNLFSVNGDIYSWLIGIIVGIGYGYTRYKEKKDKALATPIQKTITLMPHERISDLVVVAAISGLIGAKIFAIIEDLKSFFADPIGMFFSGSGLAFYGGLIGGAIGVIWFAKRLKVPVGQLADAAAPALIMAYGIGRLGCHFSGDGDWGIENFAAKPFPMPDWLWAYHYPNNVINSGDFPHEMIAGCTGEYCTILKSPVYPTSVYEFFMAFAIFGILWALRKVWTYKEGALFSLYLLLNGLERFFIEKIRHNDKYELLGMQWTQAEMIATILIILGIMGLIFTRQQKKLNP